MDGLSEIILKRNGETVVTIPFTDVFVINDFNSDLVIDNTLQRIRRWIKSHRYERL